MAITELKIDSEFESELGEQTAAEAAIHELEFLAGDAEDPIHVWAADGEKIIIDGHNHYKLCQKYDRQLADVIEHDFKSRSDVLDWIRKRQIGRRNLRGRRFDYLVGRIYNARKPAIGKHPDGREISARALAEEHGIDEGTVQRAAKTSSAIDTLPKALKNGYLEGAFRLKRADIGELAAKLQGHEDKQELIEALLSGSKTVDQILGRRKKSAKISSMDATYAGIRKVVRSLDEVLALLKDAKERRPFAKAFSLMEQVVAALKMEDPLAPKQEAEEEEESELQEVS